MTAFAGTYTVLITPFTADGSALEEVVLRDLVDWQIDQGIAGLIPLGSTGEFLSLSDAERRRVAQIVITQARGRVPVLIGAGAENPVAVVRYASEAAELGADGLLIIPPFYSAPNDEEVYAHYAYIAERVSIPMMVYNNPAITNIDLMPPLIARLATLPNVRYVKESTLDVTRVRDIVRLAGPEFGVFGGILGYESFLNGAVGWTAVGANILPAEFAALHRLTALERDIDAARAMYARLLPLIELVGGPRYVSATKTLLTQLGWPVGPPRLPRLPSASEERLWVDRVRAEMQLAAR